MDKPREFWIDNDAWYSKEEKVFNDRTCTKAEWNSSNLVHAIEIAEYEQLKKENEKAYDALAGNICGYCWQKMEEEPTAKRTNQDHFNALLAEIEQLKSKLKLAVDFINSISLRELDSQNVIEREIIKKEIES